MQLRPASKLAGDDHFCSGPGAKGGRKGGEEVNGFGSDDEDEK